MRTRIKYIDQDKLKIRFSTFIFNAERINEKFGSLSLFAGKYGLTGETNGKVFYLSAKVKPTPELYKRFESSFSPLGLLKGEDYFYFYTHPESDVELEHPSCINISWLESKIREDGNFVCFKNPETGIEPKLIDLNGRYELPAIDKITFKVLDTLDPKPDFPKSLFNDVPYLSFISPGDNCYPLFIATPVGVFPEEVLEESLEGQKIAVVYSSFLDGALIIYQIQNGKRIELKKYNVITGKWRHPSLSEIKDLGLAEDKVKEKPVEKFYLYGLWADLEKLNIDYKGCSLSYMYQQVNALVYPKFVQWAYKNKMNDLVGFIRAQQANEYFAIYKQLDNCRRLFYKAENELPSELEEELEMFRKILNPYRTRSFKNSELPQQEEIRILANMSLCIYYNNHININSFEAWVLQGEIISEFKRRDVYVKNEYLLMSHANPIEIKIISGTPVLKVMGGVTNRAGKEIPKFELGPSNPLIMHEHFYGLYNSLTDLKFVDYFNENTGLNYWGIGRSVVIRAVRLQFKKRSIDTSSIITETSFSLKYCVVLDNKKLIRLGDLPESRISPILKHYLQKCYPTLKSDKIKIIKYDLEKMLVFNSAQTIFYEIPINDLLIKKGEMKFTIAPKKI